jgi:glycosyltransferase involved in cell wall biosynthesis
MRIIVVSAFEASSLWAHAINTVKMAQGFARLGHQVTILCFRPCKDRTPPDALARTYGLTERIRWIQLPQNPLGSLVDPHWWFALSALPFILWTQPDLVFARNYSLPCLSSRLGILTVAENHAYPGDRDIYFRRIIKAMQNRAFRLLGTISPYLADLYASLGAPEKKMYVLPNGVDIHLFRRPDQLPSSPYPNGGPDVAYAGHLYHYKDIPTILEVAARLSHVHFHLIGGWPEDITKHKQRVQELELTNVTFHGPKLHSAVPSFLWYADVLLLPPSANHPSASWTSPLKLGEYLASGTPVVATSIPALRNWLTDAEVKFAEPDNAEAMAEGIMEVLGNPELAMRLSQGGLRKAQRFSYQCRAKEVLEGSSLH